MNDDATRSTLGDPEAMEALQFVIDLFVKDKVTPPIKNLMAATVTTIPLIVLFFLTQRWFVRGITMSGLGGR
jgi:ABC-type glycerol-3-phosphate transport system permease component